MGPVTRAVQAGVGLVAEFKAAKLESKNPEASSCEVQNSSAEELPAEVNHPNIDEKHGYEVEEESDDQALDEHFGGGAPPSYEDEPDALPKPVDSDLPPPYPSQDLAEERFPQLTRNIAQPPRMNCPVIIPQRRPGSKIRGFVRAYAPVLSDYDIDQEAFLNFLKSFHKASQASPTLTVFTLGVGALGNVPEPGAMLVGLSMQLIGGTAMELQSRKRANTYLDKANEEFFKPRGLYCLIMSFRPNDVPKGEVAVEDVDTSKDALKWLTPPTGSFRTNASKFRSSSGTTRGEETLPESAPLIYLDTGYSEIGRRDDEQREAEKKSAGYSKRKVTQNYFDKRAQAKYAYKHPESALAIKDPPQFASKYGDPTHPTVTASHVGRLSQALGKETMEERQAKKRAKAMQARSSGGKVRRILDTSVLYLMVVNLPREEQMEEARRATAQAGASQFDSDLVPLERIPSK